MVNNEAYKIEQNEEISRDIFHKPRLQHKQKDNPVTNFE